MPKKVGKDGRLYDVIILADKLRDEFSHIILEAYDKEVNCGV